MDKDTRALIRQLERQGYDVKRTKGGHYLVTHGGQRVTTLSGSTGDVRQIKNALADIRRHERQRGE